MRVERSRGLRFVPEVRVLSVFAVVWFASAACDEGGPHLSLEQCEAVATAQEFIADNGYTSAPASTDPSRWRAELNEDRLPLAGVVSMRRGQLFRNAVGLFSGRAGRGEGWTVLFEYRKRPSGRKADKLWGRGVFVPANREEEAPFIHHMNVRLDTASVRLSSPDETAAACGWR